MKIVSVGESTIDRYVDLNRDFVGGISLNFAVHCKRLGTESVSLMSCIGNDQSERILNTLRREQIETKHVRIRNGQTATQEIRLALGGERFFPRGGYNGGVLHGYLLDETEVHFLRNFDVVSCALFRQLEPLFWKVTESPSFGWKVADFSDLADYNYSIQTIEVFAKRVKIAFVSGNNELVEQLRPLSRKAPCLIVVTLGSEGSVALEHGDPIFQPAIKVEKALDSTGCGDAFQAAFTISYWRDRDIRRALESAAKYSASVLQHYGAIGK
jgi:fructoselysine 6-kinase